LRVLIAQNAIDTSALANSPHPSSREGRLSTGWRKLGSELELLLLIR
jgi:hypothetical protein